MTTLPQADSARWGTLLEAQAAEERLQPRAPDIKLHVHSPDRRTAPVNIRLELTSEELIEESRRAGTIPKTGNWRIYDEAGREPQPTLNLKENGLRSGKHVYVREQGPPSPPPKPPEATAPIPERPVLNYERPSDRRSWGLIVAVV